MRHEIARSWSMGGNPFIKKNTSRFPRLLPIDRNVQINAKMHDMVYGR